MYCTVYTVYVHISRFYKFFMYMYAYLYLKFYTFCSIWVVEIAFSGLWDAKKFTQEPNHLKKASHTTKITKLILFS